MAFVFFDGDEVSDDLGRMVGVGQTIDDRNIGIFCKGLYFRLLISADEDAVDIAGEHTCCILYRFTATDLQIFGAEEERLATKLIAEERKIYKGVAANVDFYSGFIYSMLDLPMELYTPIFAISRIAGWSAHRIEELIGGGKIIRPAYMAVQPHRQFPQEL